MGGYNSGRSGGGPTVESAKCITVSQIMGKRRPGDQQGWSGSTSWSHVHTGETTMVLRFRTFLEGDRGWVELSHPAARWGEAPQPMSYRVELEGVPQPFGGLRWFFVSLGTGDLAHKLFLPLGGLRFASRQAWRLGYQSQRQSKRDQATTRAWKLRDSLGVERGNLVSADDVQKPKYRHWRTFDRDIAKLRAAEAVWMNSAWAFVQRLNSKRPNPRMTMALKAHARSKRAGSA